jgi:multiple sugar transport system permease protein
VRRNGAAGGAHGRRTGGQSLAFSVAEGQARATAAGIGKLSAWGLECGEAEAVHFSARQSWPFVVAIFAPSVLLVGIFIIYPVVNGVGLAFTNASPLSQDARFVGLENFTYLFEDAEFWEVLANTLKIVGSATIIATVAGYALATLLISGIRAAPLFRAAIFQVWVVPWIVIAILWGWLFSHDYGLVNYLLLQLGVTEVPLKWLFDQTASQWAIISGYAWRAIPFIMVICLAALQGIPQELVESASIDGASFVQRQRYVILPLMQNIILVAALLQAVRFFQEMTMVFVLTQGGPVNATMVLSLYTYKAAFEDWDFGLASAIGTIWLGLLLVFALFYVRLTLRRELQ